MRINLESLKTALREIDSNTYNGETTLYTDITIQEENIQDEKLGDILTVKMTINKKSTYAREKEATIVKILEFPAETEGQGRRYKVITQTVVNYDLDKKDV